MANTFQALRELKISQTDTTATEKFCRMFDKFFDIFNTRAIEEADRKRKPDLKPFYSSRDERLEVLEKILLLYSPFTLSIYIQWLQTTLLQYLENWEVSVAADTSIPKEEKVYCTLPQQTIEGIRICGMFQFVKKM